MTDFLERILSTFSDQHYQRLEQLTQIKLYNRLLECYLVKKQKIQAEIESRKRADSGYVPSSLQLDDLVKVDGAINNLVQSNDNSKIDEHYMLFLFKIYGSEEGIVNCCQMNKNLKHELLNFYIQKRNSEKVLEVCQGKEFMLQQEPVNGDMWIQALTYLRDQAHPHDDRHNELLITALKDIREKRITSTFKAPFTKVKVQLTTFMVAGIEIIIVTVL